MAPIKSNRPIASYFDFFSKTGNDAAGAAPSGSFLATGGTVSGGVAPGNGYRYHLFLEPGNFEVTNGGNIEVLVIGGGGGSGWDAAGGGGAGGVRTNTLPGNPLNITSTITMSAGTIPVTVGDGGAHRTASATPVDGETGANGGDSSIGSPGDPYYVLASGGGGSGGGESPVNGGAAGGSGGGGGWRTWPGGTFTSPPTTNPANGTGPAVTSPDGKPGIQGNAGGYGVGLPSSNRGGGGGGGAGGAGTNAPNEGGAGGNGIAVPAFAYPLITPLFPSPYQPVVGPIIGPTGLYAGGGQGGGDEPGNLTSRTPGGGGGAQLPGSPRPQASVDGINATGSGGGGAGGGTGRGTGGDGGDGIVLIRYVDSTPIVASGGAIATYTSGSINYKTHTFNDSNSGPFQVTSGSADVSIVMVGGGGGGGNRDTGGGGGAGAFLKKNNVPVSPGNYPISLGAGGAANGGDGGDTTGFGYTAPGGGGGGDGNAGPEPNVGRAGGSSGGGGWPSGGEGPAPGNPYPGTFTDESPDSGWGHQGGNCNGTSGNNNGGGGGGAGADGQDGSTNGPAGNGGAGIENSFRAGTPESFGGGGGAGGDQDWGAGGVGGGGDGTGPGATPANRGPENKNATANTGGGGGGAGGFGGGDGGTGGTGIVIVRYVS